MAKISDVDNSSLLFTEGSAPATPATSKWRAYFKTDGLYVIDDAGTEYGPLAAAGGSASDVARVETSETTTSGTYTDLTTSGPAVTLTVPASGKVLVTVGGLLENNDGAGGAAMAFALSSGNTLAAADDRSVANFVSAGADRFGRTFMLEGLTPGSTVFTAKYRRMGGVGTATFGEREISVVTLP